MTTSLLPTYLYSPNDSSDNYSSSARDNRSSISSVASTSSASCYSPSTSPSTSLHPSQSHKRLRPLPMAPAPPSPSPPPQPQPQPISSLGSFAAEMVTWLWFAPTTPASSEVDRIKTSKLQVVPSERFMRFCDQVLTTTQVSHSVVILALLFIYRLKSHNRISGAPGSEFRLATTALMMANKYLDDNTYTAKTWAEVSSLELKPLVAGEAEFLRGLDFVLHVSEKDYGAWLKLLEGHVSARNSQLGKAANVAKKGSRIGGKELQGLGLGLGFSLDEGMSRSSRRKSSTSEKRALPTLPEMAVATAARTELPAALANFSFPPPNQPTLQSIQGAYPTPPPQSTPTGPFSATCSPLSHPFATSAPQPTRQTRYTRHSHTRSMAPPRTNYDFVPQQQQPTPTPKRRADDAFGSDLEVAPTNKRLASTAASSSSAMLRSFSAGASPAPVRSVYVLPRQTGPSRPRQHHSRPSDRFILPAAGGPASQLDVPFQNLADAVSPLYEYGGQQRPDNLPFYSLAAGQRLGVPKQPSGGVLPYENIAYYTPLSVPSASSATFPSFGEYGEPRSAPSLPPLPSPVDYNVTTPTPLHNHFSYPVQAGKIPQYSQFANSGLPGVMWANGDWQSHVNRANITP